MLRNVRQYRSRLAGLQRIFAIVCVGLLMMPGSVWAYGDEEQLGVAREMIGVLNAYAVYKMGRYDEASEQYRILAEKGSRQAMLNVANMYSQGLGTEQSDSLAFRWYLEAAKAEDAIGMMEAARAYEQGRGVDKDAALAEHWYLESASAGNAEAQWIIGKRLFDSGEYEAGLEWIRLAANEEMAARKFLSNLERFEE
ncbi:MAG: tetratricopeptide repeat protein [Marinobacter sp.]|nr:tetratricopeptide repeat protein [Marinobacter sp.]